MVFTTLFLLVSIYSLFVKSYVAKRIPICTSSENIPVFFPAQTYFDESNTANSSDTYACVPRSIAIKFHPATSIIQKTGKNTYKLHNRYPKWFDGRRVLCQDVNVNNCIRLAQIGIFCDRLPLEITFDNSVSIHCIRQSHDDDDDDKEKENIPRPTPSASSRFVSHRAFCGHPTSFKPACHAYRTHDSNDMLLGDVPRIYNIVDIHTSLDGISPTMKALCSL